MRKNPRRHAVRRPVKMPEPNDARYTTNMERIFYEPHYEARHLPVRTLSVEGVSPRVLAEFDAWTREEEF